MAQILIDLITDPDHHPLLKPTTPSGPGGGDPGCASTCQRTAVPPTHWELGQATVHGPRDRRGRDRRRGGRRRDRWRRDR